IRTRDPQRRRRGRRLLGARHGGLRAAPRGRRHRALVCPAAAAGGGGARRGGARAGVRLECAPPRGRTSANVRATRRPHGRDARAARLTAGRIASADLEWHGPLDPARPPWSRGGTEFRGAVGLRDATLAGSEPWPDTQHLDARLEWHGPHLHAAIDGGQVGTFQLAAASAEWDARGQRAMHLAGRVTGSAQQALAWLREHPQPGAYAPGFPEGDLRGDTLLDVDVLVPAAAHATAAGQPRVRT